MSAVLAPFAAVEASLSADTMRMLANAVATVAAPAAAAGRQLPVIFDAAYVSALEVDTVGPAATALDTDVEAFCLQQDAVISVRGKTWSVRKLEPDGLGWTVLRLREDC